MNYPKSDIIVGLEGGENGLGLYTLELSVMVETGGGAGCSHR